ncbi:hypothetical protein [Thermomonas sp.]|uniref:hypothetical protein n=1 Tax=Thermomonas sp. TaxID=1971895 RepID=UPI0035B17247
MKRFQEGDEVVVTNSTVSFKWTLECHSINLDRERCNTGVVTCPYKLNRRSGICAAALRRAADIKTKSFMVDEVFKIPLPEAFNPFRPGRALRRMGSFAVCTGLSSSSLRHVEPADTNNLEATGYI